MKALTADYLSAGARAGGRRVLPLLCALSAAVTLAQLLLPLAHAGEAAVWRFAPAVAPPPPPGVSPAQDAVPLGDVGQISFWAPNRGLLITGGTAAAGGVVPAGLYAYDGVSWHQLASVCGGAQGRIAWAGPDEFWTISDQRPGQITSSGINEIELEALSLCHFVGDEVVGSYAMPLGEPRSYLQMDAAGCLSPSDCWFAGQDGQPPNQGSFHLHWNGSEVSVYYDSSDHVVSSIVNFQSRLYEGLAISESDSWQPGEEPAHPPVIRTIAPAGQSPLCGSTGEQSSFCDLLLFAAGERLPEYPERTLPGALGGFVLATDGGPLGAGATQLWAAADPTPPPAGSGPGDVTILHQAKGNWTQLMPRPNGSSPLPAGTRLAGPPAPMPGTESAWLPLKTGAEVATVALLEADGTIAATDELPEAREPKGFRGVAGPIACPATNECWMATGPIGNATGGWLFHLTDGAVLTPNTDRLFDGQDGVISYRPRDSGMPTIYPDGFAEDDSLANQQPSPAPNGAPKHVPGKARTPKPKPLVKHVKSRFLHQRTLVLSFTLTATARVQLIARRNRRVVASTRAKSLRAGHHFLSLSFSLAHWPTKLQFHVRPLGVSSPGGGTGESESNETIST